MSTTENGQPLGLGLGEGLGPLPDYIRNELPDDLAAQRVQAWADARVAAERERCAVAAWTHYMDTCLKLCRAPSMWHEWCASGVIRGPNGPGEPGAS